MSVDTTLFAIYKELNILELCQDADTAEFISQECEAMWAEPQILAA